MFIYLANEQTPYLSLCLTIKWTKFK